MADCSVARRKGIYFILYSATWVTYQTQPKIDLPITQKYDMTWKAMEALVTAGKARHIGIFNTVL